MTDLVQRLRSVDCSWSEVGEWCAEAADRIEQLEKALRQIVLVNADADPIEAMCEIAKAEKLAEAAIIKLEKRDKAG